MKKKKIMKDWIVLIIACIAVLTNIKTYAAISGYSATDASNYAIQWYNSFNPNWYNWETEGYGDCANFVSQCLYAGGLKMTSGWYWNSRNDYSGSWTIPENQKDYLVSSLGCTLISSPSANQIEKGDVLLYDWENNGSFDHSAICVKVENGKPYVCAHSNVYYSASWTMGAPRYAVIKMDGTDTPTPTSFYYTSPGINPEGTLDIAEGGNGTFHIRGWAFDRNSDEPLTIHVYVGGSAESGQAIWSNGSVIANKNRSDVNNVYPGAGNNHGFDETFTVPFTGTYPVYVYAINVGGRGTSSNYNTLLTGAPKNITVVSETAFIVDLNFNIDGIELPNLGNIGTFDVYVNGVRVADDVNDYYAKCPADSEVKLQDVRLIDGYSAYNDYNNEPYDMNDTSFDIWGDRTETFIIKKLEYKVTYEDTWKGLDILPAQTKIYGEDLVLTTEIPEVPELYEFIGWSTSYNGDVEYYPGDIYSDNADLRLYSQWKYQDIKVTYDVNGGPGTNYEHIATWPTSYEITRSGTGGFRYGWTFKGWAVDPLGNSTLYQYGDLYGKLTGDTTFYAIWDAKDTNSYTVSYDLNGGFGEYESFSEPYGTLILAPEAPTPPNKGLHFQTWRFVDTKDDGTTVYYEFDPGKGFYIWKDTLLSAIWIYYINYDSNGGSDAPASEYRTYNNTYLSRLSSLEPQKEGYTFTGWAKTPDASDAVYTAGDYFSPRAYFDGGEYHDITLYAVWKEMEPDFVLPESLNIIEMEAFEACPFTYVQCSENTESICGRAFADCPNLRRIYIPENTTSIALDAFGGVQNLTILGKDGSYAEFYAKKNGYSFIAK